MGGSCRLSPILLACPITPNTPVSMSSLHFAILDGQKLRLRHGLSHTKFWLCWYAMRARCRRKIGRYALRKVCARWQKFANFYEDMCASYVAHAKIHGERNTTIDRINNSKGYFPKNCRWATYLEQANNTTGVRKITFNGETHSLSEWSRRTGLRAPTIKRRLDKGLSVKDSLTTKVLHHKPYAQRHSIK